jgi:hypothetical protein
MTLPPGSAYSYIGKKCFYIFHFFLVFFKKNKKCTYLFMVSSINNYFVMQMHICDGHRDSYDISRGAREMSGRISGESVAECVG